MGAFPIHPGDPPPGQLYIPSITSSHKREVQAAEQVEALFDRVAAPDFEARLQTFDARERVLEEALVVLLREAIHRRAIGAVSLLTRRLMGMTMTGGRIPGGPCEGMIHKKAIEWKFFPGTEEFEKLRHEVYVHLFYAIHMQPSPGTRIKPPTKARKQPAPETGKKTRKKDGLRFARFITKNFPYTLAKILELARKEVLDLARNNPKWALVEEADESVDPHEALKTLWNSLSIRQALDALPAREQKALYLKYVVGLPVGTDDKDKHDPNEYNIKNVMGVSARMVSTYISQGRKLLRDDPRTAEMIRLFRVVDARENKKKEKDGGENSPSEGGSPTNQGNADE